MSQFPLVIPEPEELLTSMFEFMTEEGKGGHSIRMLDIDSEMLRKCQDIDDLKALAKRQYRKLARELHPDLKPLRDMKRRKRPYGQTFASVSRAYKWIENLTERKMKMLRNRRRRVVRDPYTHRFAGSEIVLMDTVYDCPLPWHYDRSMVSKVPLDGYQETFLLSN